MKQREIFIEAMQRPQGAERGAYLAEVCGDDVEMRQSVEQLLADQQNDDSFFLDAPPPGLDQVGELPELIDYIGKQIGPYKIREQIGEGGMGVVFVAEQEQPVRRKVALKIIKPGMATKNVVARFEAERQALAMMEHPNIARVFDGGATDSGQPYFVMELVRGMPITEYCDEQQLTTRERLALFLDVCRAVQHAHLKGIIHRDIKPTNILVAEIDGVAVPKVIDFGVAKATGQRLTEQTVYTNFSQMVGTPLYMSPEQAGMGEVDIDTRTDVYSLGVLLYELLTGSTPFDAVTIKQAGFDEMRRIIQEDDPPRPSARVSTLKAEQISTITSRRRIDPKKYSRSLSGDLDWIVMRTLEKDRGRRYESASAFAADVQRYLDSEPVEACPPTLRYRWWKWYSRNRAGVWVASSFVMLLVVASVVSSWGWSEAVAEQKKAELARQQSQDRLVTIGKILTRVVQTDTHKLRPQAFEEISQAITEELGDPKTRYRLHNLAGNYHRFAANYVKADHFFMLAEGIGESVNVIPPNGEAWNHNCRGRIHTVFKDYEEAIRFYRKGFQVPHTNAYTRIGMKIELAYYLGEIGKVQESRRLFGEVADELEGFYAAGRKVGGKELAIGVYVTSALRADREIDYSWAMTHLEECLETNTVPEWQLFLTSTYALLQDKLGDEQIAIEFYKKAIRLRQYNEPPYDEQLPAEWVEWRLAELLKTSGESSREIASEMARWNSVREKVLHSKHPAIAFGQIRLAKWLQSHSLPGSVEELEKARAILAPQRFTPKHVLGEIEALIKKTASTDAQS